MSKNKINFFFKPVSVPSDKTKESNENSACARLENDDNIEETCEMNACNLPRKKIKTNDFTNDIVKYCRRKLNDDEKYQVLTKIWMPDEQFKFPQSGVRNLKFQFSWLRSFAWLVYSPEEDGIYCKYCVSFGADSVGKGGHEKAQAFVQNAFNNWKKALEKIKDHQNKTYHQNAVVDGQNFKLTFENKKDNIISEIDRGLKLAIIENRKKLVPIVRAVLVCGRQGLSLRGHRDDGPLMTDLPVENDGNFRALLRFAVESGDENLNNHLMTSANTKTYISKTIQNEIIDAAKKIITSELVQRINKSKCFSVIADETTDISGIEQFSICARYVRCLSTNFELCEDFLCFVPVDDVTGNGLANTLITSLKDLGVNLNFLRGQGYDGARSMSGELKGCAAIIQRSYPYAYYVHCANHNLNLAITHACEIPSIRNCIGTMKEVVNLFRNSTKAGQLLKEKIKQCCPSAKQTRLLKFCETRWVEHLNSLSLFHEVFQPICIALQELDDSNIMTDGSKPHALLSSIQKSQFIIALAIIKPIFALTRNVSVQLQQTNCDLSRCLEFCNAIHEELEGMRSNAEKEYKNIFHLTQEMAHKVGVTIEVPRRVGRQINRDNYLGEPEDYYRRSIYIPFLDHFLDQIAVRFMKHASLLEKMQNILPYKVIALESDDVQETVKVLEKYWQMDSCSDDIVAELTMWRRYWISKENPPKNFIDALNHCDPNLYGSTFDLLKIGATLPVSVASSERSFSTLRRLKTYLRNSVGQERLVGLALLNVHREIAVDIEDVIDELAKKPRKIPFAL